MRNEPQGDLSVNFAEARACPHAMPAETLKQARPHHDFIPKRNSLPQT